jgi:hypothetical protein
VAGAAHALGELVEPDLLRVGQRRWLGLDLLTRERRPLLVGTLGRLWLRDQEALQDSASAQHVDPPLIADHRERRRVALADRHALAGEAQIMGRPGDRTVARTEQHSAAAVGGRAAEADDRLARNRDRARRAHPQLRVAGRVRGVDHPRGLGAVAEHSAAVRARNHGDRPRAR